MALTHRETRFVKGMLARGDRQHDIAAYFGVNGGRIGEVATGNCDFPNAEPMDEDQLPPPGPYITKHALNFVTETMREAIEALELAESETSAEDIKAAVAMAKETVEKKIRGLEEES